MPLARHDLLHSRVRQSKLVSTHMPLARHDITGSFIIVSAGVSTHMPLARHDYATDSGTYATVSFYSHASCEA